MAFFKVILYLAMTLPLSGYAVDLAKLPLDIYCKQKNNCSQQGKDALEQARLSCEIEVQGLKCNELKKEHPDWAPLIRRCDINSLCQQNDDLNKDQAAACLRGYGNAMVDLGIAVKDMTVSLATFVDESWEGFKTNSNKRTEFLRECNKSLACKRDLVADSPRYRDFSDEKLERLSAAFLYVEFQRAQVRRSFTGRAQTLREIEVRRASGATADPAALLNADLNEKLKRMMGMVGDQIRTQYHRYSCYTPLAQEELKCYAIGSVIDPTMLAGYFVKGARAANALGRVTKVEKSAATTTKAAGATFATRAELVEQYLERSPTTVAQNEKWISLAEQGRAGKATFFDVENSQIKTLNDTLKDKNLVTSLTNFHKDVLDKKMDALIAEYPGLAIEKYSDFKSMRYSFSGEVPADLEKKLQKVFSEANQEFEEYLKKQNIVRKDDVVKDWFRGGYGETADQANLAARYSRQVSQNEVQSFAREDLQKTMNLKLQSVEKDRQDLRGVFANTSVLEGSTLHPDAFDIARKAKGDTQVMVNELTSRFGLKSVPQRGLETLARYAKATDDFSPGLFIPKRENAHLNDAVHGGLSADIIGLGSANLKGTAEALASAPSIEKALEATRLAEKAVTLNFVEQKKVFEDVVKRSVPSGKLKTTCSGDDCVSVALAPLNEAEKVQILKGLSGTKYSGNYRLAFVSDGVKDVESRNALASHGEAIEKILRKSLSSRIEPNKLKGLTFGVDMRTQQINQGQVKLLMGEAEGLSLSNYDRIFIQSRFKDAVKALNEEMSKSGKKVRYNP